MDVEDLDFEQPLSGDEPGERSGSGDDGAGRGEDGGKKDGKGGGEGKRGGKGGEGKDPDEVRLSRKDHDRLLAELDELKASERYWADKAKAGGKGKPDADPDDDDDTPAVDDTDPEKLVEEFGSKGIEALVKRGVLTAAAAKDLIRKEAAKVARDLIGAERRNMQMDAELTQAFPDLANAKSELFTRTAAVMKRDFGTDKELLRNPKMLMAAAKIADLELKVERGGKGRGGDDEDERLERVRRQAGDRGRRGAGFDDEDDAGTALTPLQRQMAKQMGVSEEDAAKWVERERKSGGRRR